MYNGLSYFRQYSYLHQRCHLGRGRCKSLKWHSWWGRRVARLRSRGTGSQGPTLPGKHPAYRTCKLQRKKKIDKKFILPGGLAFCPTTQNASLHGGQIDRRLSSEFHTHKLSCFAELNTFHNERQTLKTIPQAHGAILHDLWVPRAVPGDR